MSHSWVIRLIVLFMLVAFSAAYESCVVGTLSIPVPPDSKRCAALGRLGPTKEMLAIAQLWLMADIKDQIHGNCVSMAKSWEDANRCHT